MDIIFAGVTISMSEFKKNPAAVLREAGSVKEPLRKLLEKRLDKPPVPGAALHGALEGHDRIKLNWQGYRLVQGVQDDVLILMMMAVDKREDSALYQSAMARVSERMAGLTQAAQKRLKP